MYFYLPTSIPNFFKLTILRAILVHWSQETSKRSTKTKYTYHKLNVAQEKNQKNKKEQRTSKQPPKKKHCHTLKNKTYHTKNVNNVRQKPQQKTKRKKDDHQKNNPNIKKREKK
jgi:hypothetical protein